MGQKRRREALERPKDPPAPPPGTFALGNGRPGGSQGAPLAPMGAPWGALGGLGGGQRVPLRRSGGDLGEHSFFRSWADLKSINTKKLNRTKMKHGETLGALGGLPGRPLRGRERPYVAQGGFPASLGGQRALLEASKTGVEERMKKTTWSS